MTFEMVGLSGMHAALLAGMHRICFAEPWGEKAMADLLAMPGAYGFLALPQSGKGHPPEGDKSPEGGGSKHLPLGFILCRTAGDEAEVLTFLVLPPFRRCGVATKLLDRAMEMARLAGAIAIFLEVAADNDGARHLYSSRGFEQVGCRPRYYGNAIDALVMKRALPIGAEGVTPS
jgi:ribosomal-protein-alanine N-acetyltransferase